MHLQSLRGLTLVEQLVVIAISGCFFAIVGGCSAAPSRELPPAIGPSDAGQAAIDQYDANHDGVISGAELEKCPALAAAISRYDTSGDHKVTAANIAARGSRSGKAPRSRLLR